MQRPPVSSGFLRCFQDGGLQWLWIKADPVFSRPLLIIYSFFLTSLRMSHTSTWSKHSKYFLISPAGVQCIHLCVRLSCCITVGDRDTMADAPDVHTGDLSVLWWHPSTVTLSMSVVHHHTALVIFSSPFVFFPLFWKPLTGHIA